MHLNELKFADKPNYEMIDSLFEKALFDLNVNMRDLYDWEMEYEMQ